MRIEDAEVLLRREGCSESVVAHCKAVCKYATRIAQRADANVKLVSLAAMLHDIGRSRAHDIEHGVVGATILREHGIDERICLIVERHVGAGISAEEAVKLGLPRNEYIPQTLEEKIVCMADSLFSGKNPIRFDEVLSYYRNLGLNDSVSRFEKMYGELHEYL